MLINKNPRAQRLHIHSHRQTEIHKQTHKPYQINCMTWHDMTLHWNFQNDCTGALVTQYLYVNKQRFSHLTNEYKELNMKEFYLNSQLFLCAFKANCISIELKWSLKLNADAILPRMPFVRSFVWSFFSLNGVINRLLICFFFFFSCF